MAEALLKAGAGEGLTIGSAGLGALEDYPADPEAARLMAAEGLDIGSHRGRHFTPALALETDLILVMDERQKKDCERRVPSAHGRIFLLGHWRPSPDREIPDPFRKGPDVFLQVLKQIRQSVDDWLIHVVPKQRSS